MADGKAKAPNDVRRSQLLRQTEKDIAILEARLSELRAQAKVEKAKGLKIKCIGWMATFRQDGCGAWLPIGNLTYLQTTWQDMDGDTNYGEGAFICPKCGKRNRLVDRKHIEAMQHTFKATAYDRDR